MFGWFKKKTEGVRVCVDVKALLLSPKDRVVLSLDRVPSGVQMDEIRRFAKRTFPDHVVIILPPGMSLEAAKEVDGGVAC